MSLIFDLLRIKQWVKNLFLLIPAFFAGTIFDQGTLYSLMGGVVAFSLVASAIYMINDYRDKVSDQLHPKKKFRPIASGKISSSEAIILSFILVSCGMILGACINANYLILLIVYLLINIGYSFGLKNVPILDLFIVASGFVIRVHSGGLLAKVPVSHWLSIMVLLLALFIIIAKRRDDLILQIETGADLRRVSKSYNLEFVNSSITLISSVTVVAYIMYTISPEVANRLDNEYLYSTTIFVIAGILRYLQITFVEKRSGSPTEILLKDKFILITVFGWIITFCFIIYF